MAFKCREDAPYEVPNKTLSSAILLQEVHKQSRIFVGYWGDIIVWSERVLGRPSAVLG